MIKLSKRLKIIADYVCDNASMVDIGCDHGLLDIYLYNNRRNIKIIASDVNDKALSNAINNIKKYNLEGKIETVVSDGFDNIDVSGIDTVIISGMGAHTIVGILFSNLKKLKNIENIIVQSNNDIDFLRKRVNEIGYYIGCESLVKDAGIIYTVIKFKKGYKFYSKRELYFGPCLLKENSELFKEKCKNDLLKLEKFYPMIPKNRIHHRIKTWLKIRMYKKMNLDS